MFPSWEWVRDTAVELRMVRQENRIGRRVACENFVTPTKLSWIVVRMDTDTKQLQETVGSLRR